MRIACLVDNGVRAGSGAWGEHGLSLLIDMDDGAVLFDTGQSGVVLAHNMALGRFDRRRIRAVVLSHAHYDHTGGLSAALEFLEGDVQLFAHPNIFEPRFSRRSDEVKPIGVRMSRADVEQRVHLRLSREPQAVLPGVVTTGEIARRPHPEGRSRSHVVPVDGAWAPDPYRDDLSLVVECPLGVILICGCCHAGLLNTLEHVEATFRRPVVAIVGGTHLGRSDQATLEQVIAALEARPHLRRIALNHCSGDVAYAELRARLGSERVIRLPAGSYLDEDLRLRDW